MIFRVLQLHKKISKKFTVAENKKHIDIQEFKKSQQAIY